MFKNVRKFIKPSHHPLPSIWCPFELHKYRKVFNEMMEENVFLRKIITACWVFFTPPPHLQEFFKIIFYKNSNTNHTPFFR